MSLTYEQMEELFDDLVKRFEESRRDDPVTYDVTEIRDILYKIHSNTENVDSEGKRQIDLVNADLKEKQKDHDRRKEKNYDSDREERKSKTTKKTESHTGLDRTMGKFLDKLLTGHEMLFSGLDKRLNSWQQLYSAGGTWNGDFVKTSADINKAGFKEDEFLKNFQQSGFSGHLMGADNFLNLSGAVRKAASELGGLGIPTSEYNSELSKFVDNLRLNQDLTGRSSEDLAKKFTDVIEQSGALATAFGQTIDEFTKAKNNIANDSNFQLNTEGMTAQQAGRAETFGAATSKFISTDMLNAIINFNKNGAFMDKNSIKYANVMGGEKFRELAAIVEKFYNSNDDKTNDNKMFNQLLSTLKSGIKHYDNTYGANGAGLNSMVAAGVIHDENISSGIRSMAQMRRNLPDSVKLIDNSPNAKTKIGVETQNIDLTNESKKEKISSDSLEALGNDINKFMEIRKGASAEIGKILDKADVAAVAVASQSRDYLGKILDNNKEVLTNMLVIVGAVKGLEKIAALFGGPLLIKSLEKAFEEKLGHSALGIFSKAGKGGNAAAAAAGSILSGGSGGYNLGGYGTVTYGKNGASILSTHGVPNAPKTPTNFSFLRSGIGKKLAIAGVGLELGTGALSYMESNDKEKEEKELHPDDANKIHSEHRKERFGIIGDTAGQIGGGFVGAKAASTIASKFVSPLPIPSLAKMGLIGAAGIAGSIYGGKEVGDFSKYASGKIADVTDKVENKHSDDSELREANRKKFSHIMSPFINAISGGLKGYMDGVMVGGAAGAVGGTIVPGAGTIAGAVTGSQIGGVMGGVSGIASGIYSGYKNPSDDNVVGDVIGNAVTSIEDWWNGDKIKTDNKKDNKDNKKENKPEDAKPDTSSSDDGPNNDSILSTHYKQQSQSHKNDAMDDISESLNKIAGIFEKNMTAQITILNKLNDSTKNNGILIKNNSNSI